MTPRNLAVALGALAVGGAAVYVATRKERQALGAPAGLEEVIQKHEIDIAQRKKERGLLFDVATKEVVLKKDGGKASIKFKPEELALFKDRVLTHNHPPTQFAYYTGPAEAKTCSIVWSGGSLSPKDVQVAITHNLAEVRAVTRAYVDKKPVVVTHVMERPASGWPKWGNLAFSVRGETRHANTMLAIDVRQGKIKYADACTLVLHKMWERVAEQNGVKYYRRVLPLPLGVLP